jgi:molecular chaperone GrpE
MIVHRLVVVWLFSTLFASSEAFSVVGPNNGIQTSSFSSSSTTWLRATTDGEADEGKKSKTTGSEAMDILNSPEFLKRKRDVLKSDLAKAEEDLKAAQERLEAGKAEWGSQIEDLQKEYQQIQQRMNTQSNKSDDMATSQVARQMLSVLDNCDRAFGQVTAVSDEEKAIEAEYRKVYDSVLDILGKLGVEEVKTVGIEFDYEIHQAVMQKPSDEHGEGIVCEELQKGFKIGDTLIRAAMVAVAL